MDLKAQIEKQYGQRLRLRVCGLCWQQNRLLLVQHRGLGPQDMLYAPPGGGMEWGSSAEENLAREFEEETGLLVEVGPFLWVHEFLNPPLHALELFFEVSPKGGQLKCGTDPEMPPDAQLIQHVSFMSWEEIKQLPASQLHQILQHSSSPEELKSMRGYYKFSV